MHTPGPWTAKEYRGDGVLGVFGPPHADGGDYAPIVRFLNRGGVDLNNAKLIASAPLLLSELQIVHSRIRAILNCDDALDALCAEDVFGAGYAELLAEDEQKLREAIVAAGGETEAI